MNTYNKLGWPLVMLSAITLLTSCNNKPKSADATKTETVRLFPIASNPDNPSVIYLSLTDKKDSDTSIAYTAKGLYQNDTVSFLVEISKNIPAGINKDGSVNQKDGFKKGSITFKSAGAPSDAFVTALASLWKVDGIRKMKAAPIQPLAFSSNKKSFDPNKPSTNSFKLFFDDDSASPGEVFFTFDTYKRSIQFQEKDTVQRNAIVHALGE
ncbi:MULTISPECIES: hypothetical protein [Olivibacter]|jgi:hypothetical protein|uniref:Lipoprotein n=1 Tax=Olivibacter oleidegradans TaxID=760123 RepID=A0ABV6HRZ6_9SPHI|nr:hypothetical protein [Olivibacter jilunii]